jgi:hypothetical protein
MSETVSFRHCRVKIFLKIKQMISDSLRKQAIDLRNNVENETWLSSDPFLKMV